MATRRTSRALLLSLWVVLVASTGGSAQSPAPLVPVTSTELAVWDETSRLVVVLADTGLDSPVMVREAAQADREWLLAHLPVDGCALQEWAVLWDSITYVDIAAYEAIIKREPISLQTLAEVTETRLTTLPMDRC